MIRKLFASILLVVAFAAPVSAQETPEVEPTPVIIVDETPAVDPVVIVRDTTTALGELIAIFLSGAVIGGAGVLVVLRSLIRAVNQNDTLKLAIERIYMSQPMQRRAVIREGVETGKEGFDLLEELTDGELPAAG